MAKQRNHASDTKRGPLVFVSGYAASPNGAIHTFRLNTGNGTLSQASPSTSVEHPLFLALSPVHSILYSTDETRKAPKGCTSNITAYKFNSKRGELEPLNQVSTLGSDACYLTLDTAGRNLLIANYRCGSIAAMRTEEDGVLQTTSSHVKHTGSSVNRERQSGPHAHCIILSPDERFAFVADLGIDRIKCYRFESESATLTPNIQGDIYTRAGAGPRHLAFHSSGKHLYCINELDNSIGVYDYDSISGAMIERQTISTLPEGHSGKSHAGDLKISPDARFLYATNRGHDSIAIYRIGTDALLTLEKITPSLGKSPLSLAITCCGSFMICANSADDSLTVFHIDPVTGSLFNAAEPIKVICPSCVLICDRG